MNYFAIGDIHGCLNTLKHLLDLALKDTDAYKSHFVFLGDYIDRGPDSKGVVDLLIEFGQSFPCTFLMGNHEHLLINALQCKGARVEGYRMDAYEVQRCYGRNGATQTLASYGINLHSEFKELPGAHQDFYLELDNHVIMDDFLFSHSGPDPRFPLEKQEEDDFLWTRDGRMYNEERKFNPELTCVFGHTPMKEPILHDKCINIDTGCVYGYSLTGILLPERKIFSVECKDGIKRK